MESFENKSFGNLNPKQTEAVHHTEGPLLILAGAGAGKTKTITHRILNLIKKGVPPQNILAITFTNKAAKEMRDKVLKLISEDKNLNLPATLTEKPFISTFHSLGTHILRENARLIGIPRFFTILDRQDSLRVLKDALQTLNIDPKTVELGKLLSFISREKGNMVTEQDFKERPQRSPFAKIVGVLWHEYERIKKLEKSLDFDDLLTETVLFLRKNGSVRERYQNIWRYIHIDEYQDTNEVQYRLVRMLSEKNRNVCVVGDIDQNIYSWRGASIKNILDFEKDYPESKVVLLEENYRSTKTILEVANAIIEKNKRRKKKTLFTKNAVGEKIMLYEGYDEMDEARFVAAKAKELIERGVEAGEIAALYRANFQSRALEEAFLEENIPYQVLGVKFFERKEIKDIIAYIRAALDPENRSDFKRIINTPPRGLGKVAVLKIFSDREGDLPLKARLKIGAFRKTLNLIKTRSEKEKLSSLIRLVIKESGLEEYLKGKAEEDIERVENMRELVTFASRYDALPPEEALEKFLTDVSLVADQDELEEDIPAVRLMTVHAAKGLEFGYVFVTGLEENLFPHKKMGDDRDTEEHAEEERRLFYVALTRAKKKIYLSYASVRTIFGSKEINVPSEFLFDIDESLVEKEERLEGRGKVIYLD